ncbi:M4 family metallopeptidase [Streptomyces sp. NBC_00829]|uniref:M4 family metallopeptidase n=1 Tax=Streptomyces sp. NBC_00829 TaxID=2903679 RepID=UPI002F90D433|nr:M4 family metallopeptidase [Streptomyces sp. NBC_00829]WTB19964.1 M4 family metallopeptidase [Streptomyces sp. NBC_00829]
MPVLLRSRGRAVAVAIGVLTAAAVLGAASAALLSGRGTTDAGISGTAYQGPFPEVVKAAEKAAIAHAGETGVGEKEPLRTKDVLIDPEGKRHVRFDRVPKGVPVKGGDLVIHLDAHNAYRGVTRATLRKVDPSALSPRLTAGQAAARASTVAKGSVGKPKLIIDLRKDRVPLAHRVDVVDRQDRSGGHSVVPDARDAKVFSSAPLQEGIIPPRVQLGPTAAGKGGTGSSLYVGQVPLGTTKHADGTFTLKDPRRGNLETRDARSHTPTDFSSGKVLTDKDNRWGNGKTSDPATAAVDVHYGLSATYDFYASTFGRKGIYNDGKGPHAIVHWGNKVGNAGWSETCRCILYGGGAGKPFNIPPVSLDTTAHELSHGVVSATANLQATREDKAGFYGEPGALNESLADIFATGVEFNADNKANPPNYLFGEKLGPAQGWIRRLDKPSLDIVGGGVDYWDNSTVDREVHSGSGVSSHAFYLLAEGSGQKTIRGVNYDSPTKDGSTVKGIGRARALQIFYRALTRYMVSTTDFHQARTATLQAAADMHGADSAEYKAVDKAWAAVNVTEANTPKP